MKNLKSITSFFLTALMSLTFLVGPPEVIANSEESLCQIIYYRCVFEALAAEQGILATVRALEECELKFAVCQVIMTIRIR